MKRVSICLVIAGTMAMSQPSLANSAADFYDGKTVKIIIGAGMGGSYGLYGQLFARHVTKHMAGAPTVVVQSMPGSGGDKAMDYTYTAGAQDGSLISIVQISVVQETLFNPKVHFNAKGYQYIGRFTNANIVGVVDKRTGLKSWKDARKMSLSFGTIGRRNYTYIGSAVMNMMAGTKFKLISGYRGTKYSFLAMERHEVDGAATSWNTLNVHHAAEMKDGTYIPVFQMMGYREPQLPNTPSIAEFGRTKGEKAFLAIITAGSAIGRSLAGPPGMPKHLVAAWAKAFDATMKDPEFLADIKKRKSRLNPLDAAGITKVVNDAMSLPKADVQAAYKIYTKLLKAKF